MKQNAMVLACFVFALIARGNDFPCAITYDVLPSGQHRYEVRGLYIKNPREARLLSKTVQQEIPGCTSLTVDSTNKTMAFVTGSTVTNLQDHLDRVARGGGMVPYWEELQIRDKRSLAFDSELYSVALHTNLPWAGDPIGPGLLSVSNIPSGLVLTFCSAMLHEGGGTFLVDFSLTSNDGLFRLQQCGEKRWINWSELEAKRPEWKTWLRKPISYAKDRGGFVALNRATALCMAHSRFALRIFDREGKFVWEDQDSAFGVPQLSVCDLTGDKVDEIVLYQEDHGQTHVVVFQAKRTEEVFNKAYQTIGSEVSPQPGR